MNENQTEVFIRMSCGRSGKKIYHMIHDARYTMCTMMVKVPTKQSSSERGKVEREEELLVQKCPDSYL